MLSGFDGYLDSMKSMVKNAKNSILKIPEMEAKVLEATSSDAWGASSTQMREIARATQSYANFPIIMGAVWARLEEEAKNWRHILKTLILLDFLVKNGSEQVVRESRVHIHEIQKLFDFHYRENDKDYGQTVREKARALSDLLNDDERIHEEREKARITASKFSESISSDSYYRGGSNGGGGYGGGGGGGYGRDSYEGGGYGRDGDYGRDNYGGGRERDDYRDRYSDSRRDPPPTAARGHIRAPSGGAIEPPKQTSKQATNLFDFDEVSSTPTTAAPATNFFAQAAQAPPTQTSQPSANVDFFAPPPNTQPQTQPTQQPAQQPAPAQPPAQEFEWNDFTSVDAPKDNSLWGAHKQLFDLDNLSNPANAAHSQAKKPLGATLGATQPKPLGTPLGAAPSKPLGLAAQPVGTPLSAVPLGAAPGARVAAPMPVAGYGAPVVQPGYAAYPGVVPAGYAVATPGLAYPVGYGVPGAMGVAPVPVAAAPGMVYARPPQQGGFHM